MTNRVNQSIIRNSNRYPEITYSHWARKFNITKEEVEYVILTNKCLELDIIKIFKSLENNTASNIAKVLNASVSKVNITIDNYLAGCKIG
jgi:hypothetical protein